MKWPAHDDKALARSSAEFLKSATWYMRVCVYIYTHTCDTSITYHGQGPCVCSAYFEAGYAWQT